MNEQEKIEALAEFLMALDEWNYPSYLTEAEEILKFIDGGFDLSEYEDV